MRQNKKVLIIVFSVIMLIGCIVTLVIYNKKESFESKKEEKKEEIEEWYYQIHYYEEYEPGCNYYIYFFDETKKINVVSQMNCTTDECLKEKETLKQEYEIKFSDANMTLIWNWVDDLFNGSETNLIKYISSDLKDEETKKIIESLINNDESLLKDDKDKDSGDYKLINFTENIKYSGEDLEIIEKTKFELSISKSGTIFINDIATNIQNHYDEFYVVDIDEDGIKELITRTTSKAASPFTNNYHIYKYLVYNENFEEATTISIIGSINTFYVDGCDIKVVYNPFESPEGYIEEKHYSFLSEDYEISISPTFLNQPPNSLIIYKNNYLITKSFSTTGIKDLIHYYQSIDIDVDDIKKQVMKEHDDNYYYYSVKIKNNEKEYYLNENSQTLEKIKNILNYDGQIWYVD